MVNNYTGAGICINGWNSMGGSRTTAASDNESIYVTHFFIPTTTKWANIRDSLFYLYGYEVSQYTWLTFLSLQLRNGPIYVTHFFILTATEWVNIRDSLFYLYSHEVNQYTWLIHTTNDPIMLHMFISFSRYLYKKVICEIKGLVFCYPITILHYCYLFINYNILNCIL